MTDDRNAPRGRLGRLARLAAVGARTGASLLLDRDGSSAARQAAAVLGNLRGLAAKVGQMASYVDGVVPEAHRDAYESAMKGLRAAAPRSSPDDIRRMIESELGASPETLFSEWDPVPVASASIGQVHRARLHDGREVAVKVQHPGIAEAVESDLANAGILEGFVKLAPGGKRLNAKDLLEVVRARFREELDYDREAARMSQFARVHAGDPLVHIPAVIAERSSMRVLTSEFVRGLDFDAACAAPVEDREAWARTLWRFVFKGNLVGGIFNADPHPGNYIFQPGGAVTFLDFGCVQQIDPGHQPHARVMHRAAIDRDEGAFARGASLVLKARPGRLETLAIAYTRLCFEPLFSSGYRMERAYVASLVDEMKSMGNVARKVDEREMFNMPPEMLFMNRLQFGFYSVLARLDVCVDYSAVERGFWPEVEAAQRAAAPPVHAAQAP